MSKADATYHGEEPLTDADLDKYTRRAHALLAAGHEAYADMNAVAILRLVREVRRLNSEKDSDRE